MKAVTGALGGSLGGGSARRTPCRGEIGICRRRARERIAAIVWSRGKRRFTAEGARGFIGVRRQELVGLRRERGVMRGAHVGLGEGRRVECRCRLIAAGIRQWRERRFRRALHRLAPGGRGLRCLAAFGSGAIDAVETRRDVAQIVFDIAQPLVDQRIGAARLELADIFLEPGDGAGRCRCVALQIGIFVFARDLPRFDAFQCAFERAGAGLRCLLDGAHALVEHGDALIECARGVLGFLAGLAQPPGNGFQIMRQRGNLRRRLIRGVRNLIRQP